MSEVFDSCEIDWGMTGADAALVVAKDHIHDPVQAVFDGPVLADDGGEMIGTVG